MKNSSVLLNRDSYDFDDSRGLERYGLRPIIEALNERENLEVIQSEEDQRAGQDLRYKTALRRIVTIEGKAETRPYNHFYELALFYLLGAKARHYEIGNAQKTTADLMLYVNFPGAYAVLAERLPWMAAAQELLRDTLLKTVPAGAEPKHLYAVLNGKPHLQMTGVGRFYPHYEVIRKLLNTLSMKRWTGMPAAVFDLRESWMPNQNHRDEARAYDERLEFATEVMLRKFPVRAGAAGSNDLDRAVAGFMDLMEKGAKDYAKINKLLRLHGGIRPLSNMTTWIEALPAFTEEHSKPVALFGPDFMARAIGESLWTRQNVDLIPEFNDVPFMPWDQRTVDYFHPGQKYREIKPRQFYLVEAPPFALSNEAQKTEPTEVGSKSKITQAVRLPCETQAKGDNCTSPAPSAAAALSCTDRSSQR
jgi:hypothetical protein